MQKSVASGKAAKINEEGHNTVQIRTVPHDTVQISEAPSNTGTVCCLLGQQSCSSFFTQYIVLVKLVKLATWKCL